MKKHKRDKLIRMIQHSHKAGMSVAEISEAIEPLLCERSVDNYAKQVRIGNKKPIKVIQ